jgi:hypothetical protein
MYFSIGFTLGIILFSIGTLFIIVKPLNIWFYKKLGLDINKDTHYDLIDIAHDSHFSEENKLGNFIVYFFIHIFALFLITVLVILLYPLIVLSIFGYVIYRLF